MLKRLHEVGCQHDTADKRELHFDQYCLLILIYTGRTPTKRTFGMICFYLSGWAELEELEAHIAKLRPAASLAA